MNKIKFNKNQIEDLERRILNTMASKKLSEEDIKHPFIVAFENILKAKVHRVRCDGLVSWLEGCFWIEAKRLSNFSNPKDRAVALTQVLFDKKKTLDRGNEFPPLVVCLSKTHTFVCASALLEKFQSVSGINWNVGPSNASATYPELVNQIKEDMAIQHGVAVWEIQKGFLLPFLEGLTSRKGWVNPKGKLAGHQLGAIISNLSEREQMLIISRRGEKYQAPKDSGSRIDEIVRTDLYQQATNESFCLHSIYDSNCYSGLQNTPTPLPLCKELTNKVVEASGNLEGKKIAVLFNPEFVIELAKRTDIDKNNILFVTDSSRKAHTIKSIFGVETAYDPILIDTKDINPMKHTRKAIFNFGKQFDVVLANPPYQEPFEKETDKKGGRRIYHRFVELALETLLKDDGHMAFIHPSSWRTIAEAKGGLYCLLKKYNIKYLEMHSLEDGERTFGAGTDYDWYVLQKCTNQGKTRIKFRDGEEYDVDIGLLEYLPNENFDLYRSLLAQLDEERVEILYSRSSYGTDKTHISKDRDDTHLYPVIRHIKTDGSLTLSYSNRKNNGHFGVPKVVLSEGNTGVFFDKNGEYGLTEFAFAIVDELENLEIIFNLIKSGAVDELFKATAVPKMPRGLVPFRVFRKDWFKAL